MMSKRQPTQMRRVPVHLEWKVTAITDVKSADFAAAMQLSLNASTAEGYSLAHMFTRGIEHDMILVHQRTTILGDGPSPNQDEEYKGPEVH